MKTLRLVALVLVAGLQSCSFNPPEPEGIWKEAEIEDVPSDSMLWSLALLSLDKLDFPRAHLDRGSMQIQSGWLNHLAPFSGKGYRLQAEVAMEPLGERRWAVRTRVKKQRNMSIVKPLDPSYAEWEWSEDDEKTAMVLLMHIRSRLAPQLEETEQDDAVKRWLEQLDRKSGQEGTGRRPSP